MIQYLVNPHGQYLRTLSGTAEEVLAQIPADHDGVSLPPPRTTDYWNGTNWVNIGPAPAYYLAFDYETKTWKDTRDLAETKSQKWEKIKLERNQSEFGGFEFGGKRYDSDQISQGRILAAFVFGQPVTWTTAEDEIVELTAVQVGDLGIAMQLHVQAMHQRGRLARDAVFAAQSPEEVDAVMF